jgi:hypothetical protein
MSNGYDQGWGVGAGIAGKKQTRLGSGQGGGGIGVFWVGCLYWRVHTIHLLQHPLYGAAAPTAGHGNVELVVVFRHCVLRNPLLSQLSLMQMKCG